MFVSKAYEQSRCNHFIRRYHTEMNLQAGYDVYSSDTGIPDGPAMLDGNRRDRPDTTRRSMSPQSSRVLAATFAGLGIAGALAACAPAGGTGGGTGGGTADESYADGTYTADGSYQAPSGTESITVELTLADDKVTDITVTPHASDPTAKGMQANFAGGIADQVVGQDIDQLNVTRVSGSSLTSGGFKIAIAAIKEDALA
jgi:uncharacterized protein with FMN-binding domain